MELAALGLALAPGLVLAAGLLLAAGLVLTVGCGPVAESPTRGSASSPASSAAPAPPAPSAPADSLVSAGAAAATSGSVGTVGWSATSPRVNQTHIFQGGVNRRGKAIGFHSRPGGHDPEHAHVVRVLRSPNDLGVYEALVAIDDGEAGMGGVRKRSTFYPDRLEPAAVVAAILNAYAHREAGDAGDRGERFRGPSGLGFTIEGYLLDDGSINTAYPIY
jgi:hypothetical protein